MRNSYSMITVRISHEDYLRVKQAVELTNRQVAPNEKKWSMNSICANRILHWVSQVETTVQTLAEGVGGEYDKPLDHQTGETDAEKETPQEQTQTDTP